MSKWVDSELGKVMQFNPAERIAKGKFAKKIPMEKLTAYLKKIKGFEFAEYSAGPKFRNGDTLVAKITPCLENGKTAFVDILEDDEVAFGSSEFIVLRQNENSINDFIFYLAKSPAFRKRAIGCMEGTSGRKRVNEGALKLQVLPIPDKNTQLKIASVLSALDSKIELNNRINAELEAMAKTLYDYWFVQFDFPFDFTQSKPDPKGKPYKTSGGKMVWNEELKREIPERWEVKTIGDVATIKAGGDKPKNYSIEKTAFNNIPIYSNGITNDGLYGYTNKPVIIDQSITISARGTIGFCVLRNSPFVPIIRLIALTPNLKGSAKYFFEVLKHFNFENSGSVQQQLTGPQVKEIKLLYPTGNILNKFDNITSPMQDRIEIIKEENEQLTELRDWLLPMLMNGQVTSTSSVTGKEASYKIEEEMRIAAEPE